MCPHQGASVLGGSDTHDSVGSTNAGGSLLPSCNSGTWAGHDDVKVCAEDTNIGVVLDTKVDMFGDSEAEVASLGKVPSSELVLLNLEASLEDFFGLGASDSDVAGDLLVPSDTETSKGVSSL